MHVRISRVKMSGNGSGAPCECLCQPLMTIWRELYQHLSAAVSGAPERLFQRQRIDDKVPFRHHFHEMMTQRRGLRISHGRT
jgi:hypothetical protein